MGVRYLNIGALNDCKNHAAGFPIFGATRRAQCATSRALHSLLALSITEPCYRNSLGERKLHKR